MKIYTGTGDNGTAGLFSGERVPKSNERIDAIGDIDELSSSIGLIRAHLMDCDESQRFNEELKGIQRLLIHIGTCIATWGEHALPEKVKQIGEKDVKSLEDAIDRIDDQLPRLSSFVLPGGHRSAAATHFARAVCRRAERHVVRLSIEIKVGKPPKQLRYILIYLNRLSDYLFVMGRYCNHLYGFADEK